jgi:LPS sulfotransferase NodH
VRNAGGRVDTSNPALAVQSTATSDPEISCVICTVPRTGSWLLCEGLLATGLAGRPEEYLRPDWYAWFQEHGGLVYQHRLNFWPSKDGGSRSRSGLATPDLRDCWRFLEAARTVGSVNGVFAVKIHRNQLDNVLAQLRHDEPDLDDLQLLTSWLPNPRYVFLRRRDAVRRAVSHYRAIQSGVWWRYGNGHRGTSVGPRTRAGDPPIDPEAIHQLLQRCARQEQTWADYFDRAGVVPLALTHEELVLDLGGGVDAVLRHLGIDPSGAPRFRPPKLARQADSWTDRAVHEYVTWSRANVPLDEQHYGFDITTV